jgi:hypothetical protein
MKKNMTRRNKTEGGKRKKSEGGRRKTRKMSKGASEWNKKVMEVYREMKKKDSSVRLGAAMKKAAELKRKGQLY